MPEVLTGQLDAIGIGGADIYPHLGSNLHAYNDDYIWTPTILDYNRAELCNQKSYVHAQTHGRNIAARCDLCYIDDFYYRIHIDPNPLALGALISEQFKQVYVWNAFFASKTLESVTKINADGINITEPYPAPTVFYRLEYRIYDVNILMSGPPSINAQVDFAFTGLPVNTLAITGDRVVLFPYTPNWEFTEKLSWLTDIIKTRQGEQRIALREAPRQAFNYQFWLSEQQFATLKNVADKWNYRIWGLPIWTEYAIASANAGATEILFDTTNADWRTDGLGAFSESDTNFEVFQVETVIANKITIKSPLNKAWSNAFIFPVRLARTPEGIGFERNGVIVQASADFMVQDSIYLGHSDYPTYDGYEVYEDINVIVSSISERINLPQVDFDSGQGTVTYEQLFDYSDFAMTLGKIAKEKEGFWRWRQWLHYRMGRQKPFLLPSWNEDLIVLEPITALETVLICSATNLPLFGTFPLRVRIEMKNGTIYYRKVMGAENGDPGEENITLNECLGVNYNPEDFKIISYLYLVRLNNDDVEINYYGHIHNETNLSLMRVPA